MTVAATQLPVFGQYPAGVSIKTGIDSLVATGKLTSTAGPVDVVDIRSRMTKAFTAAAGDSFSASKLFSGTAPSGGSIVGYKVALRAGGTNGTLTLDGQDASTKGSFTADEFSRLQFTAGPNGSSDDLIVVAQSGKRLDDGTIFNEIDSPAVQITANVTGARSIDAAAALLTDPTGADSAFVKTARQASIFTGFGAARPTLTTVGNLTATAGDNFAVSKLFNATGGSIAGYKVALRANGSNGTLTLDGQDASTKGSFTADEFSRLQFTAGPNGTSDDLVVIAQSGKRLDDGTLFNEVDSPAVQITASATGARSINAAAALLTDPTGTDGAFVKTARQASIFTGFGAARPGLTTVGNLTATAGDNFAVSKLFSGTAPSGGSIVGYKVALRADGANGTLTLDGQDASTKGSFTADEFSRLQFTAGPNGTSDDLVVVAQSGKRLADGTIFNEIDSPAVQITASATGARSIDATAALLTDPTGADSAFVKTARQASIFTGFGAARPGLTTIGNLTATAGDNFAVSKLFSGTAPSGGSIAGYKVALRANGSNGTLTLDGQDASTKNSFTADEFGRLQFTAGPNGASDDLVVVAQSGKLLGDGTIFNEIDSPAVQITTTVTGARSINASSALLTDPTGSDGTFVKTARQASIFTGFGATRPTLTTVGNLTATAGDSFSMSKLFSGTAPKGGTIVGYKVALRADGANGTLTLDGQDASTKNSFTADEFSRLQFTAGANGTSDDLVVIAQNGKRLNDGTIFNEIDSPAVQITASATGARSINAAAALLTDPTGADSAFVKTARQASIFTGFGAARPSLSTAGTSGHDAADLVAATDLLGAFQSSEQAAAGSPELDDGLSDSIGQSLSSQSAAETTAQQALDWVLAGSELGGFQSTGSSTALQRLATAAYRTSTSLN